MRGQINLLIENAKALDHQDIESLGPFLFAREKK